MENTAEANKKIVENLKQAVSNIDIILSVCALSQDKQAMVQNMRTTDLAEIEKLKIKSTESCSFLRDKFLSCVERSSKGLECFEGTDIVLPARCK